MLDKPGTCFPQVMGSSLQNWSVFNPIRKKERSRKENKTKKKGSVLHPFLFPFSPLHFYWYHLAHSKWKAEKKMFCFYVAFAPAFVPLTDRYNPCCSRWRKSWYNEYVTVLILNHPQNVILLTLRICRWFVVSTKTIQGIWALVQKAAANYRLAL